LTDWHLQIISAPVKISGSSVVKSDKTYTPWIIGTDANATSGPAKAWLDTLSSLGMTADTTRFANRDVLDKWIYDQIAVYKDHPAFYGVMLADEPSYHNAYCYGEIYKSLKRIMPDIYVPLENDSSHYFFNKMANSGILFQYAFDYADSHRKEILNYGDVKNFNKNFVFTNAMFDELMRRTEEKKITGNKADKDKARELSEPLFKAYVARDVFGDEAFYVLYEPIDEILQEAISKLKDEI
jgi:hypothetical protein